MFPNSTDPLLFLSCSPCQRSHRRTKRSHSKRYVCSAAFKRAQSPSCKCFIFQHILTKQQQLDCKMCLFFVLFFSFLVFCFQQSQNNNLFSVLVVSIPPFPKMELLRPSCHSFYSDRIFNTTAKSRTTEENSCEKNFTFEFSFYKEYGEIITWILLNGGNNDRDLQYLLHLFLAAHAKVSKTPLSI